MDSSAASTLKVFFNVRAKFARKKAIKRLLTMIGKKCQRKMIVIWDYNLPRCNFFLQPALWKITLSWYICVPPAVCLSDHLVITFAVHSAGINLDYLTHKKQSRYQLNKYQHLSSLLSPLWLQSRGACGKNTLYFSCYHHQSEYDIMISMT